MKNHEEQPVKQRHIRPSTVRRRKIGADVTSSDKKSKKSNNIIDVSVDDLDALVERTRTSLSLGSVPQPTVLKQENPVINTNSGVINHQRMIICDDVVTQNGHNSLQQQARVRPPSTKSILRQPKYTTPAAVDQQQSHKSSDNTHIGNDDYLDPSSMIPPGVLDKEDEAYLREFLNPERPSAHSSDGAGLAAALSQRPVFTLRNVVENRTPRPEKLSDSGTVHDHTAIEGHQQTFRSAATLNTTFRDEPAAASNTILIEPAFPVTNKATKSSGQGNNATTPINDHRNNRTVANLIERTQQLKELNQHHHNSDETKHDEPFGQEIRDVDVTFSVMSPEEYEEKLKVNNDANEEKDDASDASDDEERISFVYDEKNQKASIGCNIFSDDDENKENYEKEEDDDDDDDAGGLFDELLSRPATPIVLAPPSSFMKLWTALSAWVTPQTCELLRYWNQHNQQPCTNNTQQPNRVPVREQFHSPPSSSALLAPYDTSDVGSSRCHGLMNMIRLHIKSVLVELSIATERHSGIVQQLGLLMKSFDYAQPMIAFKTEKSDVNGTGSATSITAMQMWKALAYVLTSIVLINTITDSSSEDDDTNYGSSISIGRNVNTSDLQHEKIPRTTINYVGRYSSIMQTVGIAKEEYLYLCNSCFKPFYQAEEET